jgi:NADH-quinone oxidoreductase subunit J
VSKLVAAVAGGLMLVVMVGALRGAETMERSMSAKGTELGLVKNLGKVLFSEYLFPFEISSVLLLAAMVGAILIGKKETKQVQ